MQVQSQNHRRIQTMPQVATQTTCSGRCPCAASPAATPNANPLPVTPLPPPPPPTQPVTSPDVVVLPPGHVVGYDGQAQWLGNFDWNTREKEHQCSLVKQRRSGWSKMWRKPLPSLNVHPQDLYHRVAPLLAKWFSVRGLDEKFGLPELAMPPEGPFEIIYHSKAELPCWGSDVSRAAKCYHGTKAYNVMNIMQVGLQESFSEELGHDFHAGAGVYCSPHPQVSLQCTYATPQDLFGMGVYCQMYFQCVADRSSMRTAKSHIWVVPTGCVHVVSLHVRVNVALDSGSSRLQGWEPYLEALPEGHQMPPSIGAASRLRSTWRER